MSSSYHFVKSVKNFRNYNYLLLLLLIFNIVINTKCARVEGNYGDHRNQNFRGSSSSLDDSNLYNHSPNHNVNSQLEPPRRLSISNHVMDDPSNGRQEPKIMTDKFVSESQLTSPSDRHHHQGLGNEKKRFGTFGIDHSMDVEEDGSWGLGHLFKLKFGSLAIAAVIGVAIIVLFVPFIFGGGIPSHGGVVIPGFLNQIMPNLGYDGHDGTYDPYTGSYSSSYGSVYRSEADKGKSGRSVLNNGRHRNGTMFSYLMSTVSKTVHNLWGQLDMCAEHVMCIHGHELTKRMDQQKRMSNNSNDDGGKFKPDLPKREDDLDIDLNFENILETMDGMKGLTKNMPLFHQLSKAFKSGQEGQECSTLFKKCPIKTATHITKAMRSMRNFIVN